MKNVFVVTLICFSNICMAQTVQNKTEVEALSSEKDATRLNAKLVQLLNSGNEQNLSTVVKYYLSTGQTNKADSVKKVALKRFPHGNYAFKAAMDNYNREENPGKLEQLFEKLRSQFPDKAGSLELDYANGNMAYYFAKNKNTDQALKRLASTRSKNLYISIVANALLSSDPKAVADLLRREIDLKKATVRTKETSDTALSAEDIRRYNYQVIYSKALLKLVKPKEALSQVKEAYDHLPATGATDARITYASVLIANEKYQEAFPILQNLLTQGKSNNYIDQLLLTVYSKVFPGQGPQKYVDSLKQVLVAKMMAEIPGRMVDRPCPDFAVTDESGKKLSLSDFKGKTIVLDFWATWCGPCKASFPAMQIAVNRYKNDPGVQFLFVHTSEFSPTPQKDATAYLKANHYDLPLYMDLKDPSTGKNPAISVLGVQGLPTKFVIDGNGHIRFKLTGFSSGMDQAHAAELSAMIEMARKAS